MLPNAPSNLSEALGHAISDKRLEVLRRIAGCGSISQAAREAGISYKAAWQALDILSALAGVSLVEKTVGGSGGGGARLTAEGAQLLELAEALAQARRAVLARFTDGAALSAGLGLRTSMRNQLAGKVLACESGSPQDPTVWVHVEAVGGVRLRPTVTRESVDLLGLAPGLSVWVLSKATAVSVGTTPPSPQTAGPPRCDVEGCVRRVTPGGGRDEVVLALPGGAPWVGFAPHPCGLRPGQPAWASVEAHALVLALPS